MSAGRRACRAGGVQKRGHEVREEFGCGIGVYDIGGPSTKEDFVEKTRCEGVGIAVWEGEDKNSFCETVDDGKGFGFAGCGVALSLIVHGVAGAGFVGAVT